MASGTTVEALDRIAVALEVQASASKKAMEYLNKMTKGFVQLAKTAQKSGDLGEELEPLLQSFIDDFDELGEDA